MAKRLLPIALGMVLAQGVANVHAQSFADQSNQIEAQIKLLDQRRMLNEALQKAADPLLTSMPRVLSILGIEDDLSARLVLANGTVSTFRVGEVVRGSMTIAAISPRSVLVKLGKKKHTVLALEFVAGATSAASSTSGAGAGLQSGSGGRVGQPMPVPLELLPAPPRVSLAPAPVAAAPVVQPAPGLAGGLAVAAPGAPSGPAR